MALLQREGVQDPQVERFSALFPSCGLYGIMDRQLSLAFFLRNDDRVTPVFLLKQRHRLGKEFQPHLSAIAL